MRAPVGNYFGLDADEFSLRAFIQIQLGIVYPQVCAVMLRVRVRVRVRGCATFFVLFFVLVARLLNDV